MNRSLLMNFELILTEEQGKKGPTKNKDKKKKKINSKKQIK